jgi:hypothetical protein
VRPGPDIYFFHAPFGVCRNPANVFRNESAKAAHLSHHWTAFTVSTQTVERSTLGTAGFKREIAIVARINPSADAPMIIMRRLRFFAATPVRGTSIEERFGAKPPGAQFFDLLVFVLESRFRSGQNNGRTLKQLSHREHAGHDRHYCHDDERARHSGFDTFAFDFSVEIIALMSRK